MLTVEHETRDVRARHFGQLLSKDGLDLDEHLDRCVGAVVANDGEEQRTLFFEPRVIYFALERRQLGCVLLARATLGGLVIARALMVHGRHFRGFTEGRRFVPSLKAPSFGSVRIPAFSERFSFFPEQHIGRLRGRIRGLALVWVGMVE